MENTNTIDLTEKRKELVSLWQDLFGVCQTLVKDCQQGNVKLRGSLLRELNSFLKESARIIKELEEIERQKKIDQMYSEADEPEEADSERASFLFPKFDQSEPLKIE